MPFYKKTVYAAFVPAHAKSSYDSAISLKRFSIASFPLFESRRHTCPLIYRESKCVLSAGSSSGYLPRATCITLFLPRKNLLSSLHCFAIILKGPDRMFVNETTNAFRYSSTASLIFPTRSSLPARPRYLTLVRATTLFLFDLGMFFFFRY